MEDSSDGGVAGGSEAISAAANAAAAFNNFASTIEAIMGKLTGETPGAEETPGEPGKPPVTLQSQIDDLVTKSATLAGQVSSYGADLSNIKFTLLGIQMQLAGLKGLLDPFQQPNRMGGVPE